MDPRDIIGRQNFDSSGNIQIGDPNALDDYGMPQWYGKTETPKELADAGITLDADSRYGNYSLQELQAAGLGKGSRITGLDANSFLSFAQPSASNKDLWSQTQFTRTDNSWKAGKPEYVLDQDFKLKDALKIAAPIFLSLVPGLGAGLSASFGGGIGGNIAAGAIRGGLTSGLSGGNIGRGLLTGGVSAGIGGALKPVFGNSIAGRAAAGAVTSAATAKVTGRDPFSAGVLGAIGGANVGRSLGLEGATANFVNDLTRITAQVQLANRKKRGN